MTAEDPAPGEGDRPAVPVPGTLAAACRGMAVLGGLVLVAMLVMTVASILRRTLLGAPLPGDFELVEMGSAVAAFAFLPWCQITGGNVVVDLFTRRASARANHLLAALGDLIFLGIALLLGWRLAAGAAEFLARGEASMVLRLPVWWGFVVILPALALLAAACLATLAGHLREARR